MPDNGATRGPILGNMYDIHLLEKIKALSALLWFKKREKNNKHTINILENIIGSYPSSFSPCNLDLSRMTFPDHAVKVCPI